MRPERFELPTCCSGGNRSIQLSYGRVVNTVYMGEQRSSNAERSGMRSVELVRLTSDRVDRLYRRLCRRGRGQNHHRRHRRAPFSDVLH